MRPGFRTWSVAAAVSTLGDSVTYFALGWAAAAYGPGAAGLVVSLVSVPLCVLILAGGALADRCGIRRTMLCCDLAMVVASTAFLLHALGGASVLGLCLFAVAAGTASALRRPADGAFPRLFVDDDGLARAMAGVSLLQQAARTSGPAIGGLLLGLGGLPLTAGVDVASYLLVLGVLASVRPPRAQAPSARESLLRGVRRSLRAAVDADVAPVLGAIVLLAASVLPAVILCVPLAGHERGWGAAATGVVAGCWSVGTFVVTAVVARRGSPGGWARWSGPLVGALGAALLAGSASVAAGVVAMLLLGVGTSTWTTAVLPLFVRASPADMIARFQALLGFGQNVAVMVALPVLGAVASVGGSRAALGVVVVLLAAAALVPWPTTTPAATDSGACPTTPNPSSEPARSGNGSSSPG